MKTVHCIVKFNEPVTVTITVTVTKKAGGRSSAGLRRIENKLVPGLNPPLGDMKSFLAQQRLMYDA